MRERVAVTGEGPTDYGCRKFDEKSRQYQWQWGPVKVILERCMKGTGRKESFDWIPVEKEEWKRTKLLRSDKGLRGRAIPARKFRNLCREQHIFYGIFYTDADRGEDSGKEWYKAEKHFNLIYEEVRSGLGEEGEENRFIPMIPLKMIENWLLSDTAAYEKCFGRIPTNPALPRKPELIWGDKDSPESDYPKNYLSRVLADVSEGKKESNREVFCELAEGTDIQIMRKSCPLSFDRFYKDIQNLYLTIKSSQNS